MATLKNPHRPGGPFAKKTPAAKTAKDPRGSDEAPKGGTVTQTHMHHTALEGRRNLDGDPATTRLPKSKEDSVTVRIPHKFNLQVMRADGNGSHIITYEPGVDEMPRSHAEHEYSIAHGVEIIK